jgi:hypothetical protein
MTLEDDYWTGHLSEVEASLKRSIRAYLSFGYKVKIGITNDPNRRANEHSKNIGWKRMVVKYRTSSNYYINNMERILIDHHWIYIENEVRGGGGRNAIVGPYYLYVLLG